MADDLEKRTVNERLFDDGFMVLRVIPDKQLPESLTRVMIELAKGEYTAIQIIPGDLALAGYAWKLAEQSHIVYVKENPKNPDYEPGAIRMIAPIFIHRETGERNIFPIHTARTYDIPQKRYRNNKSKPKKK